MDSPKKISRALIPKKILDFDMSRGIRRIPGIILIFDFSRTIVRGILRISSLKYSIFLFLVLAVSLQAEEINLVPNGSFEKGDVMPYHWGSKVKPQKGIKILPSDPRKGKRVKEGVNLLWVERVSGGKCIKFFLNEEAPRYASICEVEGMSYDSKLIQVEPRKKYRIEVQAKSTGPEAIIFVKGCKIHPERGYIESYRAPLFCHFVERKSLNKWESFSRSFKIPFAGTEWIKVSLYGYGAKKGELYFDEVKIYPETE